MKHLLSLLFLLMAALAWGHVPPGTDVSTLNKSPNQEKSYRNRVFRPYYSQEDVRNRLRVNNYSLFENPTGILFKHGESINISVGGFQDGSLELIIHSFEQHTEHSAYPLKNGNNTISAKNAGLGYINYRHPKPASAPAITVRIEGGQINGLFTHHDDAATWKKLLSGARCSSIDMIGERVQLVFHVNQLRQNCPDRGPELLAMYDYIIRLQQEMMGWTKYKCHPGNHIFGLSSWSGYMFASGMGAGFHFDTLNTLGNPDKLKQTAWGVAHEFGHVNQVRPGMKWAGLGEVSNNLYSSWANYKLNPASMRLEHEHCPNFEGKGMRGGRFDCYINNAIVNQQLWQYHAGPDSGWNKVPDDHVGDHFVTLCPLWQLQLYFAVARGMDDFYPDIFHMARKDKPDSKNGELRVRFITRACQVSRLNLSEFFVKTGMLAQMSRYLDDYGYFFMSISKDMCQKALMKAATYPEPDSSVIYYITANNVHLYKNKQPVKVRRGYKAKPENGLVTIRPSDCRNAVAYEAWNKKKLVRIALLGLNHDDNLTTDLPCPEGTDAIYAVQWDGKRIRLWKK